MHLAGEELQVLSEGSLVQTHRDISEKEKVPEKLAAAHTVRMLKRAGST